MIRVCHSFKLFLFAALSLADLALTWFLLERGDGSAYERNPVAAWWLGCLGWPGLAGFKLGTVLLTAVVALMVSGRRPRVAGRLLDFGCVALLIVLFYSGFLVGGMKADAAQLAGIEKKGQELDQAFVQRHAYAALLDRLRDDLIARRCTLAEAVEILEGSEYVRQGNWTHTIAQNYPGRSLAEHLAACLVKHMLLTLEADSSTSRRLIRELDAQFRSSFGRPLPCPPEYREDIALEELG